MKKAIIYIILLTTAFSCKKEPLMSYTENPRVYFDINKVAFYNPHPGSTAGNVIVDFSTEPSDFATDTLVIPVKITGPMATEDRTFNFDIDKGNANEGVDYKILNESLVIPSGKIDTSVAIVLLRNEMLKTNPVTFTYSLAANENFGLGPDADSVNFASNSTSNFIRIVSLKITVTDVLKQPSNWNDFLFTYFGEYSEAKYRFIIDVLRIADFPSNTSARNMNSYKSSLLTALDEYNNSHPEPLKDENGNEIVF